MLKQNPLTYLFVFLSILNAFGIIYPEIINKNYVTFLPFPTLILLYLSSVKKVNVLYIISLISTFLGIATFASGLNVISGVSTFGAPLRIGFAGTTDHEGVALGATVGFGTSAFFQDGAAIYMGDDSDLKIFHDSSNPYCALKGKESRFGYA